MILMATCLTGTVKWFNNKAGFGFITVCDEGDYNEKDIFVHYSSLKLDEDKYKYLVQGEYVEFNLANASKDGHEFQAVDVTGIRRGPIMCESRRIPRTFDLNNEEQVPTNDIVPVRRPNSRASGQDNQGFTAVEKKTARRRPPPKSAVVKN